MTSREDTDEFRLADVLPDGYIALGFAVSVKALDDEGDIVIVNTRSDDLTAWEALGMLTAATDDLRAKLQQTEGDD